MQSMGVASHAQNPGQLDEDSPPLSFREDTPPLSFSQKSSMATSEPTSETSHSDVKISSQAHGRKYSKQSDVSTASGGPSEESVLDNHNSAQSSDDGIKKAPMIDVLQSAKQPDVKSAWLSPGQLEAGTMHIAQEQPAGGYGQIGLFTINIIAGIIGSQLAYGLMPHNVYHVWYEVVSTVSLLCLAFIMINVGYEFTLDKSNLRSYGTDTIVAMTAAGFPWLFVAGWFIWALPNPLPWKEALVMGRFAAPTSAGVLFCMLEAAGLKETWLFKKARVLAIFDDLDTILFMVPLKAILIGLKWELFVILAVVFLLLGLGYKRLHTYQLPKSWRWTMMYALVITFMTEIVYYVTQNQIAMEAIHIEVLLPAFILGAVIYTGDEDDDHQPDHHSHVQDARVQTIVSALFMVFVGLSMPPLFGDQGGDSQHEPMSAGEFAGHCVAVSMLMVLGKMFPVACYQTEANLRTRFALAMGMCPRGEVGAGVILISLDLGIKGEAVGVAIVCLALNMVMTGGFILAVKRLICEMVPDKQGKLSGLTRIFGALPCKKKSVGVVFAFVVGLVNAIAFYALNAFVSHVTGSTSKIGMHAENGSSAAYVSAGLVLSFILGSAVCGCIIKRGMADFESMRYGIATQTCAILLLCVVAAGNAGSSVAPYLAAAACGLLNAICTSFSGGVVRVSHVTGIATDIGLLCGRLVMRKCGMRPAVSTQDVADDTNKLVLLTILISSFFTGIVLGSILHANLGMNAFLIPAMITSICSAVYTSYHYLRYPEKSTKEFKAVLPFTNVATADFPSLLTSSSQSGSKCIKDADQKPYMKVQVCPPCKVIPSARIQPVSGGSLPTGFDLNFPGAVPGPEMHKRIVEILADYGFTQDNTIFGTSICADEINTVQGTMVDCMNQHWGYHFPLGGIGGAPYAGKTGFGAFSAHVPDDGNVLVLFGPHVGITANGEIGKCLRDGQDSPSLACGACVAAYQQGLAGGMKADMSLDIEQSWLRDQIAPYLDRITEADKPMLELAKVSYEAVLNKMMAIKNTKFGKGKLALVGGIQINMPPGHPDYFMPLHFTIEQADVKAVDVMDTLRGPTILPPTVPPPTVESVLVQNFSGAMPGPVVHQRMTAILKDYGIEPRNSILGTSICSDEINTLNGGMVDKMVRHWGTNFPLGGIGGAPYGGKTGFGAFSAHVPDKGNRVVVFGPHVGISLDGEVGKCVRNGQSSKSTACGACVAAYNQALAGATPTQDPVDLQQSWLCAQIAPHANRIKSATNPMAELARTTYEAVQKKMTAITDTNSGPGYLVRMGGIQINMPVGLPDYFLPLCFTIQRENSEPEDLLGTLCGQSS